MAKQPNVLFLMTDQMQARVLEPDSPCLTPNLDRLASMGVRFRRAHTPNAICSPARAGLMTGLLPHNHGVLTVTHVVDEDQSLLRTEHPHWAQRLVSAGYRTGYFGKWHVERTETPADFGWQTDLSWHTPEMLRRLDEAGRKGKNAELTHARYYETPGYKRSPFYGVTETPPEERPMGVNAAAALEYLDEVLQQDDKPWCCFLSVSEPHDPFVAGREAFDKYDVDSIELAPNVHDELAGRPNVYKKAARIWRDMSDREHREAAACYFASITEIDQQFGRLIDRVDEAGKLQDTIIVMSTDHGELLGAHGLYCKNFSASEEIYNIPLIMAGPGIAKGVVSHARVGLHDLCPTLLELAGAEPIDVPDSTSFASVLRDPAGCGGDFETGYAEYFGGRYILTQRIAWKGPWKFVLNGFDFDELYNLQDDPFEMHNLVDEPECSDKVMEMTAFIWRRIRDTGDTSLLNSHYPILRLAPAGPLILEDETRERT